MTNKFKYFVSFFYITKTELNGNSNAQIGMDESITYEHIKNFEEQTLLKNLDLKSVRVTFFHEIN